MPSFDIISEFDKQELVNALDQANREITTRYDFKNTNAKFFQKEENIMLEAQNDFQIKQMQEILRTKLAKIGWL